MDNLTINTQTGAMQNNLDHPNAGSLKKSFTDLSTMSPNSAYFATSASKAKFLIGIHTAAGSQNHASLPPSSGGRQHKYSHHTPSTSSVSSCSSSSNYGESTSPDHINSSEPISPKSDEDLERNRSELINRLSKKLDVLKKAEEEIRKEIQGNDKLREHIFEELNQSPSASQAERDKCRRFVEEISTVTALQLNLSGRIARVENALSQLPKNSSSDSERNSWTKGVNV